MKNHNCTSTPAPAACQPDNVRGFCRCAVSLFQRGGCRVVLWFLQPERQKLANATAEISTKVKMLQRDVILGKM